MSDFQSFLATKDEHYAKIDRFRAWRFFEKYKEFFGKKKIIHIIGTNGKGSTGRFLAQLLRECDCNIAHFTSPHLFQFNERFWKNGAILSDDELNFAHKELENTMKEDIKELSYFEYATFLAMSAFRKCDFIIFEAGLGGEYDATSVFEKQMSIFTKIDYDHMHILGTKLEDIARTKLKVMSKIALISDEQDENVFNLAQKIALLKNSSLYNTKQIIDEKDKKALNAYALKHNLPQFLLHNLRQAFAALSLLIPQKEKTLSALQRLKKLDLRGRCEQIAPNIFVDVGHNEMAALALVEHFKGQKFTLVYNSFLDKNIFAILKNLKPLIDKITIYKYFSQRTLGDFEIKRTAKELGIVCEDFQSLKQHERYLVFGSFVLVEHFLKENFETT